MYSKFTWRIVIKHSHKQHVQLLERFSSSQRILTKPQIPKIDSNDQEKTNEIFNLNNEIKYSKLDGVSIFQESKFVVKNVEEIRRNNEKWREIKLDTSKLLNHYLKLSKFRLTSLVALTSMMGYAMAPSPFDFISFLSCTIGTGLVSSAANSINQFLEVPFDAQMSRTRNRVLVQGHLSSLHAVGFAAGAASTGLLILYFGANSLTAALGASNLILYTMIYTPLKRISILNTWVGSVVGAIPPLMGWAACQGSLETGAFVLGGILYAWQFPHFNALSWNLRPDYSKAGYRMMAVTDPGLCRRTALQYTMGITAISSLSPVLNLTHWSFAILSLPINLYFSYLSLKFFKDCNSQNSRKLFRFSLLHLPLLMGLMLITKQSFFSTKGAERKKIENLVFYSSDDNYTAPIIINKQDVESIY